jgi:hypothetical protein
MMPAPGHKIRIPPELMPDDETALNYFDLYFTHVHPYVPVLLSTMEYGPRVNFSIDFGSDFCYGRTIGRGTD